MTLLSSPDLTVAPCLGKEPLAGAAGSLIEATRSLGPSRAASVLRAWCVAHVFALREQIFDSGEDPIPQFQAALIETAESLRMIRRAGLASIGSVTPSNENEPDALEDLTGDHYAHLFHGFSASDYWDESRYLLSLRLTRNGIALDSLRGKSLLDAGCGGGRYTGAWRLLGAEPALGIDISRDNVEDACERARAAGISNLNFQVGNVLALDLPSDSFDIVFSNGVLHHTTDWQKGVAELVRVLKPGGLGWLYLIERPGGLFWDAIEILRLIMQNESRAVARQSLRLLDIPPNRIFYMLDHVMAPINLRLSADEVESCLTAGGAVQLRRLDRGTDFDRIEQIFQQQPYAVEKFGVGENRYIFSKS